MILKNMKKMQVFVAFLFILSGFLFRLLPHPANFAPIAALALFSGSYLRDKMAFFVPFLAMILSDFFLGFYEWQVALAVYGSFFACVLSGKFLADKKKIYSLPLALLGSLLFFVSTNFAVWAFTPWYQKTASGLIECFVLALPFFRNTLLGDVFFTALFFGLFELITHFLKSKQSSIIKQQA